MNILLIITTSNGRKQLFLNEEFGATQLSDLIATLSLEHSTLEVVSRAGSPYIRSKKDGTKSNNLTSISVSYGQLQKKRKPCPSVTSEKERLSIPIKNAANDHPKLFRPEIILLMGLRGPLGLKSII